MYMCNLIYERIETYAIWIVIINQIEHPVNGVNMTLLRNFQFEAHNIELL